MKLTKSHLKQLIKEELQKAILETNETVAEEMALLAKTAGDLRASASLACGTKAAQLEVTLKTGQDTNLSPAVRQAQAFKRCEKGTDIEYSIEELAQDIGQLYDKIWTTMGMRKDIHGY